MSEITFLKLRNAKILHSFHEIYMNLLLDRDISDGDLSALIEIAIIFLNSEESNIRLLGYRIVLKYSLLKKDYKALYDVAINMGFIPIAAVIERSIDNDSEVENFFRIFISSYNRTFIDSKNRTLTVGQKQLAKDFDKLSKSHKIIVAPTSYGKSDTMIKAATQYPKSCIIVPTVALLSQTKSTILKSGVDFSEYSVITHQDMFSPNMKKVVAVLTQERLISLLQDHPNAKFDQVSLDEAHNLLDDDSRAALLASVLILLKKRNQNTVFNFFTPFLNSVDSISSKYLNVKPTELRKTENLKSEVIYLADFRNSDGVTLEIYDQFLNTFVELESPVFKSHLEVVYSNSLNKNIIYLNSPRGVEDYCAMLLDGLEELNSDLLRNAARSIREYVHNDYFLLKCIRRGVVYHHGSMPDSVKLYIEHLYRTEPSLKYIVTTSTLLEGVNIPAQRLFILSTFKGLRGLTSSQLKNLIGRVSRFGDIFSGGIENLELLMPHVYLIGVTGFVRSDANLRTFLQNNLKIDKKQSDLVENVLLDRNMVEKFETKSSYLELIESVEPNTTGENVRKARTKFGLSCYKHRISEFDIIVHEVEGQRLAEKFVYAKRRAKTAGDVVELIYELFVAPVMEYFLDKEDPESISNKKSDFFNLERLGARNYHALFLKAKIEGYSVGQMVSIMRYHWEKNHDDGLVFVGRWGDKAKEIPAWKKKKNDKKYPEFKNYINILRKSEHDLNNIAIVRIKEQQDILEHFLLKFVEVLNDMHLVEPELFQKIKYGTLDLDKVFLIQCGLSPVLAALVLKKYRGYIILDKEKNAVHIDGSLIQLMEHKSENEILIHEVRLHV